MYLLIIFIIAWVLSPIVFIPMLISMSSRIKKKDDEIRRLNERLTERPAESVRRSVAEEETSSQLTIEDIRGRADEGTGPDHEASAHMEAALEQEVPVQPASVRESAVSGREAHQQKISAERRRPQPVRREAKPRVRKKIETGHILFGIGVVLVFVAGLIFATSMWSIMPSFFKVTTLIGAALFFVLVAWIMQVKLKLREASITMFVLGAAFLSLAVIAIGYFAWFGKGFSLGSGSRYLVISVSLWVLAVTLVFGYKLYGSIVFQVISYVVSCGAFTLLMKHVFKKGDITLLLAGLYLLATLIFLQLKGVTVMRRVSCILSYGYVVTSLLMYFAFGFNGIMSIVMLADIAMMTFIAISGETGEGTGPYAWIYYAIPVIGAFFIFNTSSYYKYTIPHGDVVCALILILTAFFVYRYVPIRKQRRLANLSSLVTLLICFSFSFGSLITAMDRSHDSFSDIGEVLPGLILFMVCAVVFSVEYLRTLKPLKREEADFFTWAYLSDLCLMVFISLYALTPVSRYAGVRHAGYVGTLIPLGIILAVTLAVILLYQYRMATNSLTFRMIFTQRLGNIMLNAAIIISFAQFIRIPHDSYTSYLLNIPLITAVLVYQVHTRLKHNNPDGILTACIFPFVLMSGIDRIVERVFPEMEAVRVNTVFEIKLLMFLSVLVIGLFIYKKLYSYNRETKRLMIDWNALMAFIILVVALTTDASWDIEHLDFRGFTALSVFILYIALKLEGLARRIALSLMTACLCCAYVYQDFVAWNIEFDVELKALSLLVFAAVLKYVIFRNRERIASYISFGIMCIFFIIQWYNIDAVATRPAMPVINIKITIFMFVVLGAFAYGLWRKSLGNELLTLALTVMFAASCIDNRRGGHLIIAAVLCIALIVYFYRKGRQPLCVIPITTLLIIIGDTLNTRVAQFVATGSFDISGGILVEAKPNHTPQCVIWIIVFAVMLALGRFLHARVISRADEEHLFRIDWFTILSLVPALAVLGVGNRNFKWSVSLLMSLYLFGYYKRVKDFLNKPILTAISVCTAIAWWTQPIVRVRELFVTELRIVGFLALVYVITKLIYKKELDDRLDFMYYASVASVIWQSVSAIKSAKLFDVIILGIVLLAMIIIAFEKKSRRWFLLSAISLVCIFLYMSRDFWRKIVWPVYVFAVGIVLIFFATRNEYRKKHPVSEEDKKKLFEGWGR